MSLPGLATEIISRDVLIHVQDSLARTVSLAPNVAKRLQDIGDRLEILEALEFVFLCFVLGS